MLVWLDELCAKINRWFDIDRQFGTFEIKNGMLKNSNSLLPLLKPGLHIRIMESNYNDGVYAFPVDNLKDEVFDGAIWTLSIPYAFLLKADEIENWRETNKDTINSPFDSESFAGYSYSKNAAVNEAGNAAWEKHFERDLDRWRKARCRY